MDWRDVPSLSALRAFEAAARTGSLSAAARELNVTHAAISQHVRSLESRFGLALLVRDGQRMAATEEGSALAERLTDGFGTIAAASRAVIDRARQRPLRIATTPGFAANWLMPRIGRFWAVHPEIPIEVLPSIGLVDLRRDGVDLAIRYGHGGWPGVTERRMMSASFVAVASAGVPVSDLSALQGATWLLETGRSEERMFARDHGLDLGRATIREFPTAEMERQATLAGLGVSILPWPLAEADVAAGRLTVLFRQPEGGAAYFVLTRDETRSAARDTFIRWLTDIAIPA